MNANFFDGTILRKVYSEISIRGAGAVRHYEAFDGDVDSGSTMLREYVSESVAFSMTAGAV
jgi:hypothetical protein